MKENPEQVTEKIHDFEDPAREGTDKHHGLYGEEIDNDVVTLDDENEDEKNDIENRPTKHLADVMIDRQENSLNISKLRPLELNSSHLKLNESEFHFGEVSKQNKNKEIIIDCLDDPEMANTQALEERIPINFETHYCTK
mmetsp:Transcript_12544/g.12589  ORF Transcript_12544/g.12589 Transcript_12544/m.12589 type:complete len:140 (-) Transcript_12544:523-942(-)